MTESSRVLNNRGFSLVELIVAISIGAIVAASISALIVFSVRIFDNESKNTGVQYEVQTSINQMVNSIEQAQWFEIAEYDTPVPGKIKYAAFGKSLSSNTIAGEIYVAGDTDTNGRFNIYMNRYDSLDMSTFDPTDITSEIYLLSEGATKFDIDIVSETGTDYYTNPVSLKIMITYEKDGMGKTITRDINDQVYLRNRLKSKITYKGTDLNLSVNSTLSGDSTE